MGTTDTFGKIEIVYEGMNITNGERPSRVVNSARIKGPGIYAASPSSKYPLFDANKQQRYKTWH